MNNTPENKKPKLEKKIDLSGYEEMFENEKPLMDPAALAKRRERNRAAVQQAVDHPELTPRVSEKEAQKEVDRINALFDEG